MNIFITGATGFIGRHLVRKLAEEGHTVHALVRKTSNLEGLSSRNIHLCFGSLEDPESIGRGMRDCGQVYHLAAFARVWDKDKRAYYRINVEGVRHVMDAAKKHGISKMVFASTAGVFPPAVHSIPVDEQAVRRPEIHTEYERSKSQAEDLVQTYVRDGLPVVVVNPTNVFGPGPIDESNSIAMMIRDYIRGRWKFIPGNGKGVMDYVYVSDVVAGMQQAMEKGRVGEQYILGGHPASYNDLFETIRNLSSLRHRLFKIPLPVIRGFAIFESLKAGLFGVEPMITPEWVRKIPYNWSKSSAKARAELGYQARSFEESVKQTIRWLRETRQI